MGDKLGYGGFLVGALLVVGGCFHRIAAGNAGSLPVGAAGDRQAIEVATVLMIVGGIVATAGGIAGYLLECQKRKGE